MSDATICRLRERRTQIILTCKTQPRPEPHPQLWVTLEPQRRVSKPQATKKVTRTLRTQLQLDSTNKMGSELLKIAATPTAEPLACSPAHMHFRSESFKSLSLLLFFLFPCVDLVWTLALPSARTPFLTQARLSCNAVMRCKPQNYACRLSSLGKERNITNYLCAHTSSLLSSANHMSMPSHRSNPPKGSPPQQRHFHFLSTVFLSCVLLKMSLTPFSPKFLSPYLPLDNHSSNTPSS